MRREMWRLLYKKMEPAPVNFCQAAGRFRHHARRARAIVIRDRDDFACRTCFPFVKRVRFEMKSDAPKSTISQS